MNDRQSDGAGCFGLAANDSPAISAAEVAAAAEAVWGATRRGGCDPWFDALLGAIDSGRDVYAFVEQGSSAEKSGAAHRRLWLAKLLRALATLEGETAFSGDKAWLALRSRAVAKATLGPFVWVGAAQIERGALYGFKRIVWVGRALPAGVARRFAETQLVWVDSTGLSDAEVARAELRAPIVVPLQDGGEALGSTQPGGSDSGVPSAWGHATGYLPTLKAPLSAPEAALSAEQAQLFEHLRQFRLRFTRARGQKPFQMMGNRTLLGVVRNPPRDRAGFLALGGLGEKKWQSFGDDLLAQIRAFLGDEVLGS